MYVQDNSTCSIEVSEVQHRDDASDIQSILDSEQPLPYSTSRIRRVPRQTKDYEKYYVPKLVSIGPYHFGYPNLKLVEKLKPVFTMKLLKNDAKILQSLFDKLGEESMVKELRSYYGEYSIDKYSDNVFTKMMILDGCFILYYILFIFGGKLENYGGLESIQIELIHQDLFLLENQIPFKVLTEVMQVINTDYSMIKLFIEDNILASERPKKSWFGFRNYHILNIKQAARVFNEHDHLLHILHTRLTNKQKITPSGLNKCTFRPAYELMEAGIHFKPSNTMSLAHIGFVRGWGCSSYLELPTITVDESTKPMLLNLIAYEMSSSEATDSWVTSYIFFLGSLIEKPEDIKVLRNAGVLDCSLGSDAEVINLFKKIRAESRPNLSAYLETKFKIRRHYDSLRRVNESLSQFKHQYAGSIWQFLALVGGIIALFLTAVQTYFTVWSTKG